MIEKRLHRIVAVNEIQFGCMSDRRTIDAMFIVRRLHEECHAN